MTGIKFKSYNGNLYKQMEVKIIRSARRKKTIQAKMVKETLVVYMPDGIEPEEENRLIEEMRERFENKRLKRQINEDDYLRKRFFDFNHKYFQGGLKISSIEFVTNQERKSGSCTPDNGTIRISHKLLDMPKWVLDYVIMHEMTHLEHPNHSHAFWKKVGEYKYAERARGFLIAKGMDEKDDGNTDGDEL